MAHANDAVTPPILLNPEIGAALNEIVLKCLEKSPENRCSNVTELQAALSGLPDSADWTQEKAEHWWNNVDESLR